MKQLYIALFLLFCCVGYADNIASEATRIADNAGKNRIERDRKIVLDGVIERANDGRRSIIYRFSDGNQATIEKDLEHAKRVGQEIEKEGFEVKVYKDKRTTFEKVLSGQLEYDVGVQRELVLMSVRWK